MVGPAYCRPAPTLGRIDPIIASNYLIASRTALFSRAAVRPRTAGSVPASMSAAVAFGMVAARSKLESATDQECACGKLSAYRAAA